MRTFLALELPEEAVATLEQRLDALKQIAQTEPIKLSWVRAVQLHLTLRFFGDITVEQKDSIVSAVDSVVVGKVPVPVSAAGLGVFPGWRRPRVLWAGLTALDDSLQTLFSELDDAFDAAGLGRHDKATFHPHITLARVRRASDRVLERLFQVEKDVLWGGTYDLSRITLFQSELQPSGAVYTPLQQWSLGSS